MTIETPSLPDGPSVEAPTAAEADGLTFSAEEVGFMMRSISHAQSRMAEEHATHEAFRDRLRRELNMVDEAEEQAVKPDRERVAYLTAQLEAHLLARRMADDSVKSIKTPWGRIESREQQPEYQRDTNSTALSDWAASNGFVRTHSVSELAWDDLKARCHSTIDGQLVTDQGEVVPGVTVVTRAPKVTLKVYE